MVVGSKFLDSDSFLDRDQVVAIIQNDPERVTYQPSIPSQPMFKRILVDDVETAYTRCFSCEDKIYIIKFNPKNGTNGMLRHNESCHDVFPDPDNTKNRSKKLYQPLPEDLVEKNLENAERMSQLKGVSDDIIWKHFVPTGELSKYGNDSWGCCRCSFRSSRNISRFKEHMIYWCTNVPDDVREDIRAANKHDYNYKLRRSLAQAKRDRVNPHTGLRRKRSRRCNEDSYGRTSVSGDDENGSDWSADGSDLPPEAQREKAVEILSKLLAVECNKDGTRTKPLSNYSNDDLEREIKELKVQKLRNQVKESEVSRREKEERIKLYRKIDLKIDQMIKLADVLVGDHRSSIPNGTAGNILVHAYDESVNSQEQNDNHEN